MKYWMKLTLLQYGSSDYRYQNKIKAVCPLSGLDPAVLRVQKEAAWWIRAGNQPAWEGAGAADKARAEIKACVFASGPQTWRYKDTPCTPAAGFYFHRRVQPAQGLTHTQKKDETLPFSFCILHHRCSR